jgi:outer membrane protein assembly factor BamB
MRLNWSGATDFELATAAALERPRRLTPPPVIIPGTPPRAAVADAGGTLVLMRGPQMEVERVWRLGDDDRVITRGPAVLNNRIAVILNDLDLICLDPTNNKPVWTYTTPGDGFVGLPVPMGAGWAVADRNGSMTLLDAHTGQPVGPGLSLPGLVAAAGPMIPMGPDRLFVVLTDGSAQVISAEQLTK